MSANQHRLLAYLRRAHGWVTAAELSAELGVTSRSVRSYVAEIRAASHPNEVISSSPDGYRINPAAFARFLEERSASAEFPASPGSPDSPAERGHRVARRLANAPHGIDVYALAAELFVSESTLEADLRRLRREAAPFSLGFARHQNQLRLTGAEADLRKFLSHLFRAESPPGFLSLARIEQAFALRDLAEFEAALGAMLTAYGFGLNGFAVTDVLLHLAIAVGRTRDGGTAAHESEVSPEDVTDSRATTAEPAPFPVASPRSGNVSPASTATAVSAALAQLVARHFGVSLTPTDQQYLGALLTSRGATRAAVPDAASGIRSIGNNSVGAIVLRIAEQYRVNLTDDAFISRLTLHVDNLVSRVRDHGSSRNPMARTIKTTYPLNYEIAASIANEIGRETQIAVNDDEIAYIALHVGAALESAAPSLDRVTCAVICPRYHGLQLSLVQRLNSVLGGELQIDAVIQPSEVVDPEPAERDSDLVVTTVAVPRGAAPRRGMLVSIHPILTENDVADVRQAIGVVRRRRRQDPVRAPLLGLLQPALFERNLDAASPEVFIRALGDRMIAAGVIGSEAVDGAIARERLSSTAFTDTLAVPHAFAHTAYRSAICFAVNETAMPWGESRVHAVAFLVLSRSDQAMFPGIFDLLVSAFADRVVSQRLVAGSLDFASFTVELERALDA